MATKHLMVQDTVPGILDNIVDVDVFKKNKKLQKIDLTDDIVKKLVLLQKETDQGLNQLIEMCLKGKDGK